MGICANVVIPWASQSCRAQLARNEHPKHPPENGKKGLEDCHWKGQHIVGLCANFVRPCKPPQICAKLGTPRGTTTRRDVQPLPDTLNRHVTCQHGLAKSKVSNISNMATRKWRRHAQTSKLLLNSSSPVAAPRIAKSIMNVATQDIRMQAALVDAVQPAHEALDDLRPPSPLPRGHVRRDALSKLQKLTEKGNLQARCPLQPGLQIPRAKGSLDFTAI